jgi:hypothetical protein
MRSALETDACLRPFRLPRAHSPQEPAHLIDEMEELATRA